MSTFPKPTHEPVAALILDAARDFRRTAGDLASRLAGVLQVPARDLVEHRYRKPEGTLDDEWAYGFHGLQCRFDHLASGQVVQVEIAFGDEFGVLDAWFLALFINSTPGYAERPLVSSGDWNAFDETGPAIDRHREAGFLAPVQSRYSVARTGYYADELH